MRVLSQDKTISEIFRSYYFKVPRFQRPFSWTKDNIDDFWADTVDTTEREYFIGSMVVYEDGEIRGVVDGQQRLTTITIALAGIRDQLKEHGFNDLADGLQQYIERRNDENVPQFVLQTETSYPYFQAMVLSARPPVSAVRVGDEERAIQAAYEQIRRRLENQVGSIRSTSQNEEEFKGRTETYLKETRDKLLKLKLIFIELDNEDDAYIIFETLNTRGKDLEIADLVKNHYFKLLRRSHANLDLPKEQWGSALKNLEENSTSMNEFLPHYWNSRFSYVSKKDLFKDLKLKVQDANASVEYQTMLNEVPLYGALAAPTNNTWDRQEFPFQSSLIALDLFKVAQPFPALLAGYSLYKSRQIALTQLIELATLVENYHFITSAVVGRSSSGTISKEFASFGQKLRAAPRDFQAIIRGLHDVFKNVVPGEDEFKPSFKALIFTNQHTKQKKLIQYILGKFDKHYRVEPAVDYGRMTIEHLLPQAGNPAELVGQLGNMIYVSGELNGSLGRKPFAEKLQILAANGYPIDENLRGKTDWTAADVSARTEAMAGLAFNQIWKV